MNRHEAAFWEFHQANPHVYEQLERLALQLYSGGVKRWGIKALWEIVRYELMLRTTASARSFALNNNLTAYYARLLMSQRPELDGFFETRERRGDHSYELP